MPQINIDCSKYDCGKIRELLEDEDAQAAYLGARDVDPASEQALTFTDDLFRIYIKCCWEVGARPLGVPEAPPAVAGGSTSGGGGALAAGAIAVPLSEAGGASSGSALRLIPVWGWALAYLMMVAYATHKQCIDHSVNCLLLPRKTGKTCLDCVRRCNRTGSWPHNWCYG